jgi:hypothetical protein
VNLAGLMRGLVRLWFGWFGLFDWFGLRRRGSATVRLLGFIRLVWLVRVRLVRLASAWFGHGSGSAGSACVGVVRLRFGCWALFGWFGWFGFGWFGLRRRGSATVRVRLVWLVQFGFGFGFGWSGFVQFGFGYGSAGRAWFGLVWFGRSFDFRRGGLPDTGRLSWGSQALDRAAESTPRIF